ncbi:hypothetical protein GHK92_13680 [Nocardioides sp. dk4132]|uniref:hypothetical protein n=1 Tax=unclassified Nocardioides TaxID=2615069 RepID=UPI001295F798|nr:MULTISPECIES: hypothetical protein [unclassified Nocardioides]MQW76926.1 hypothetical protein [Nocardioides sp. dk4132]QGA09348.1 hypothetical protein GFH29_19595 [Nocardioides sp. dk884]
MRIVTIGGALLLALVLGFAAGWLVFDEDEPDDREVACAGARSLPEDPGERWGPALANQVHGVAMLAQGAGSTGEGLDDLDELGRAGRELQGVLRDLEVERYDGARAALLEAC